ncbi:MAG: hypothetical protein GY749_01205 [Desulfobacteraceae bacterium]|nr:hypothetical protein [Desulfobacteraceae bacterium]
MTQKQREETLKARKARRYPWHSPPHIISETNIYHISAACYEHNPIIGQSFERMAEFEAELLNTITKQDEKIFAWCILPNHYHLLVNSGNIFDTIAELGRLHGRTSYRWNQKENRRGRKCWYRCSDRAIRSERHKWVTLNYIYHNPVHHGYVKQWQEWTFSSAGIYLEKVGYDTALTYWKNYPLLDYGKGWDDPEL